MTLSRLAHTSVIVSLTLLISAPAVQADSNNKIKFRSSVSLKVGQAAIIHGKNETCGQLPTKAELAKSKSNLDATMKTGYITFGKPGVRKSGRCNGWTPAYETIFVAVRPGSENVKIHGDTVRITVK